MTIASTATNARTCATKRGTSIDDDCDSADDDDDVCVEENERVVVVVVVVAVVRPDAACCNGCAVCACVCARCVGMNFNKNTYFVLRIK